MDHFQGSAKRRQPHDAATGGSSPKRQYRSTCSPRASMIGTRSTIVDDTAMAPQLFSAEITNKSNQQSLETSIQNHDSGSVLHSEDYESQQLDTESLAWLEGFDDHNFQLNVLRSSEIRDLLDQNIALAASNITNDHLSGLAFPAVSEDRLSQSPSEGSTTHSATFDLPHPSVEVSQSNTRQSSVETSITTEAQDTISRIRGQLLHCQNDPAWSDLPAHFRARLTSMFEICSASVTPSQRIKTPPHAPTRTKKQTKNAVSKRSNPDLWYSRFMQMKVADFVVPDALQHHLNRLPNEFLNPPAVELACGMSMIQVSVAGQNNILAKRILYMRELTASSDHHSILVNINCLFFFLVSHGSLDKWKSKSQDGIARKLWHTELPLLFEMLHPHSTADESNEAFHKFKEQVRGWQKKGSLLTYLAQQVGLGSIVLLHEHLRTLYGATRGTECVETGGIFASKRPSDAAFRYLRSNGILAAGYKSGATRFVQQVLKELFKGFSEWKNLGDEIGFPGFDED